VAIEVDLGSEGKEAWDRRKRRWKKGEYIVELKRSLHEKKRNLLDEFRVKKNNLKVNIEEMPSEGLRRIRGWVF